jgi:hypothetical protein
MLVGLELTPDKQLALGEPALPERPEVMRQRCALEHVKIEKQLRVTLAPMRT